MRTPKLFIVATTIMFTCLAAWPVSAADSIQAVGTIGYCGAPAGIRFKPTLADGRSCSGIRQDQVLPQRRGVCVGLDGFR
jgi:hypothetical protein